MLLVITGPSGAGKSTLIQRLLRKHPQMQFSVSHTTRPPRPGEREGKDYYFVSEAVFSRLLKRGAFVEWAVVHGYRYGTSKAEFKKGRHKDLVLDIDVQGAAQIKKILRETHGEKGPLPAVFVFILPPDQSALENRLLKRGDLSAPDLRQRLARAREEISGCQTFDYVVINRNIKDAVKELEAIIQAEHCRPGPRQREVQAVLDSFGQRPRRKEKWPR